MLAVALLFAPLVSASACDVHNNDPDTGLNYEDCNNAGRCVQRTSGQWCECCDNSDDTNWCYGRDLVPGSKFTGDSCTTVEFVFAVGFGWRFETPDGSTPAMTCSDMDSDPPSEGGIGYNTSPMIMDQVNAAMKVGGYNGISLGAACKTCRADSKCDFSNSTPVSKGVTAGFVTELNTHYDRSCVSFQIETPKDCDANYDMGASAYKALHGSFGAGAAAATYRLNTILDGTAAFCGHPEVKCLDWTDTTATVFAKHDYTETKTFLTTPQPTPVPTEMPTEEAAAPGGECTNMTYSVCGGTIHSSGVSCCPAGQSCFEVVPGGYLSMCSTFCVPGWACDN